MILNKRIEKWIFVVKIFRILEKFRFLYQLKNCTFNNSSFKFYLLFLQLLLSFILKNLLKRLYLFFFGTTFLFFCTKTMFWRKSKNKRVFLLLKFKFWFFLQINFNLIFNRLKISSHI